jgi:hypothetical protein
MSALDEIAYSLGKRDDLPNQELARKLAGTSDIEGIQEIADHLWDKNPNIQSDCLKVLYEVGMLQPTLIGKYARDFLSLLHSKNNRLVWGAMIALSTIGALQADELFPNKDEIIKATREGSVITTDNGIKTLAQIGSTKPEYASAVFPFLLEHLQTCRPKEVPQHAEHTLVAVNPSNWRVFKQVLEKRMVDLTPAGLVRIKKVLKAVEKLMN